MSAAAPTPTRPKRFLRVSKACDYCHRRRIKCRASQNDAQRCQNCVEFDLECATSRPLKRGRAASSDRPGHLAHASTPSTTTANAPSTPIATATPPSAVAGGTHSAAYSSGTQLVHPSPPLPPPTHGAWPPVPLTAEHRNGDRLSPAWQAFALASGAIVRRLLGVYFETVYPIFPLFDRQNVERRLAANEQVHNRGFFCTVMAACALASARVRDGAIVSPETHSHDLTVFPPETFFSAARDTLPGDVLPFPDFDYLRACALLSIASMQDGKINAMRMYIGHYFTMNSAWQWHDEANWPTGLSSIDLEERRRLYWSTYTLDIFTSLVWDGCINFQEAHARVEYPCGGTTPEASASSGQGAWIVGWNFTTDLYRILEHVIHKYRTRSSRFNLFGSYQRNDSTATIYRIQEQVNHLYTTLPNTFKELRPATGNLEQDIYGFQAANIQATLALLRMALLSLEVDVDLEKKCSVVSEVLATFHQVPKAFQRAISTPLVYHIGGIGNILGSVMEAPMSEVSYQRVRSLLISMADLLEGLESFLRQRAGAGRKLRERVERIDAYMSSKRSSTPARPLAAMGRQVQEVLPIAPNATSGGESLLNGISPVVQIPDELLQHWNWPMNVYHQSQFPYFGDAT